MRLFGLDITRSKSVPPGTGLSPAPGSYSSNTWWWPTIREPFAGAWQRNMEMTQETGLRHHAVYSCISLIGQDVAKTPLRLVEQNPKTTIWEEVTVAAFSPVLRKPNRYQSRIQFFEQWIYSLLTWGNTYVLLERDNRNVIVAMYILDPARARALLAPDGAVYYQLYADYLTGVTQDSLVVPASEVIHDRISAIFHPLCGMSPLTAVGLAAIQGIEGQRHAIDQFRNQAVPSGILTAPGEIPQDTADRIKAKWQANYSGQNVGRVAILGNGMKFEKMAVNPIDAQFIEQMKWTAEAICGAYHVPAYKVTQSAPTYNNVESLEQQYYTNCLQSRIENIELLLDEGFGLADVPGHTYGVEFDVDEGLMRMDKAAKIAFVGEGIRHAIFSPNEARARFDIAPVKGGDVPFLQQQYWPIDVLTKRENVPAALIPVTPGGPGGGAQEPKVDLPPPPPTGPKQPGTPGAPGGHGGGGGGMGAAMDDGLVEKTDIALAAYELMMALREEGPPLPFGRKYNPNHEPAGSPAGGQFASDGGGGPGAGSEAVSLAIRRGGRTLDCYDGRLPHIYAQQGFTEVARLPFNPDYANPGWNTAKDDSPDVVFMAWTGYPDGGSAQSALARAKGPREAWIKPRRTTNYVTDYDAGQKAARDAAKSADRPNTRGAGDHRRHQGADGIGLGRQVHRADPVRGAPDGRTSPGGWLGTGPQGLKYNPNHVPAGSPDGGQFAEGDAGSAGGGDLPKDWTEAGLPKPSKIESGKFTYMDDEEFKKLSGGFEVTRDGGRLLRSRDEARAAVMALPKSVRSALASVPITITEEVHLETPHPLLGGGQEAGGLFHPPGSDAPATGRGSKGDIKIGEWMRLPRDPSASYAEGVYPKAPMWQTEGDFSLVTSHELGHALDQHIRDHMGDFSFGSGGSTSVIFHERVVDDFKRLTPSEQVAAHYWSQVPSEGYAETFAMVYAPNAKTAFNLPIKRAREAFFNSASALVDDLKKGGLSKASMVRKAAQSTAVPSNGYFVYIDTEDNKTKRLCAIVNGSMYRVGMPPALQDLEPGYYDADLKPIDLKS